MLCDHNGSTIWSISLLEVRSKESEETAKLRCPGTASHCVLVQKEPQCGLPSISG